MFWDDRSDNSCKMGGISMKERSSQNYVQFPISPLGVSQTSSNGIRLVQREYRPLLWLTSHERRARKEAIYRHAMKLQKLHHPLFAQVMDVREKEDSVIVIREWVEGESYRLWRNKRAFITINDLKPILLDLAEAMKAAQEYELPFTRIEPEDIILNRDGRAILADYGFDRSAGSFRVSDLNVHLTPHRYTDGVQSLALFAYESLTGFITENTPLCSIHTDYLPARIKYAIEQTKHMRHLSSKAVDLFVESLYPPTHLALFRMAWKPATAIGLFGVLATVGGHAFSQRDTPPTPSPVVISQPAMLGSNLSQEDIALLQLAIRRQGVAALLHPAIAHIFQLSQDQYAVIEESLSEQRDQTAYMINNAASGQNIDVTNEMKVQREELQTRILMIMTPSQRAFWESLSSDSSNGEVPPL
jgi:hypothetical protein